MKKIILLLVPALVLIAISTTILYKQKNKRVLPIYNPTDVNKALVDSSIQNKGINHTILNFNLTNQDGESVNQQIIKNKVVVADFFFTTCPSICPKMTSQLKRVYDSFSTNDQFIILSHTVWPEVDSVDVLKDYSQKYGADSKHWQFLTGDKHHLYNLARKSYLISPSINDTTFDQGGEGDFIHTVNVVLVDQQKRIRGYYDGTDSVEISQLVQDIDLLLEKN